MRTIRALAVPALSTFIGLSSVVVFGAWQTASATPEPLTIAYVASQTGPAATEDAGGAAVFQAAIESQNAKGGIDGHKLVPLVIDDETSPTALVTGVQEAISRNVIGIVTNSALFGLAARYPQEAGVPVTGNSTDGPEWGEQPNTNMFGIGTSGSVDPSYPVSTLFANVVKLFPGTRMGVYAESVSPDSVQANSAETQSVAKGDPKVKVVVNDASVVYGSTDFGPEALVAKENGVNVVWANIDTASAVGLATAFSQAGVKASFFFPDGYGPSLPHSPAWQSIQGDYFEVLMHPFYEPNAGTEQMQTALEKYAGWTKSQFPTFTQDQAWLGAQLMFQGIEGAGANPTRASVIKSLRSIKSWNGDGLLPFNIDYATGFGKMSSPNCVWITKVGKTGFIPVGKNPVCGTYIPGSTSKTSS